MIPVRSVRIHGTVITVVTLGCDYFFPVLPSVIDIKGDSDKAQCEDTLRDRPFECILLGEGNVISPEQVSRTKSKGDDDGGCVSIQYPHDRVHRNHRR